MSAELKAAIIVGFFLLVISFGAFVGYRYENNSSRADTAEANVVMQAKVIQSQAGQSQAFNAIADNTGSKNTVAAADSEKKVIEYRTILKREKTCDMPVPADIAFGLLSYANRLRASAVSATPGGTDPTGTGTSPPGTMTYCQAVLWINPLLTALEQANNKLAAIRQADQLRQGKTQ